MNLKNQRRIASQILKCGVNRVYIDPNRSEDAGDAITRADVRTLIDSGAVYARQKKGISTGRAEHNRAQKRKGRQSGHGSRRGKKGARRPTKATWMRTIRSIRRKLRELRDSGKIDASVYREYYLKAKGGQFKSRPHLESHLKSEGVLKE